MVYFFSRFGVVRFVTVLKKNKNIIDLIHEKHDVLRKLLFFSNNENISIQNIKFNNNQSSSLSSSLFSNFYNIFNNNNNNTNNLETIEKYNTQTKTQLENQLFEINKKLNINSLQTSFPVLKVYITFEHENHQRLCLRELEVPDLKAMFNIRDYTKERSLFRGINVLDVQEPPEPNNILWSNLETPQQVVFLSKIATYSITILMLVSSYYSLLITNAKLSPLLFAIIIGFIDSFLPIFFVFLTDISAPSSEGHRQNSLEKNYF
jgi:hypothetical protein